MFWNPCGISGLASDADETGAQRYESSCNSRDTARGSSSDGFPQNTATRWLSTICAIGCVGSRKRGCEEGREAVNAAGSRKSAFSTAVSRKVSVSQGEKLVCGYEVWRQFGCAQVLLEVAAPSFELRRRSPH